MHLGHRGTARYCQLNTPERLFLPLGVIITRRTKASILIAHVCAKCRVVLGEVADEAAYVSRAYRILIHSLTIHTAVDMCFMQCNMSSLGTGNLSR